MVKSVTFEQDLKERTEEAERILRAYLPDEKEYPGQLAGAMNYSVLAGGKRIRPILLLEAYAAFGGQEKVAEPFAAAIEMIHTSSLVHDDLPEIDNDSYRRGKKTTHAVYGPALGVLAGDALLNAAYETALKAFSLTKAADRVAAALQILAKKTGISGMLGGQGLDVENEKNHIFHLKKDTLDYIYLHKTGALLEAPLMIGAVLAGANAADVRRMEEIGRKTGLAFQIEDDILDVTGSAEEIGKPTGSDQKNDKTTYVTLLGVEEAQKQVQLLSDEAAAIVEELAGENTAFLKAFIEKLAARNK